VNRRTGLVVTIAVLAVVSLALSAFASDAEMYFSSDKNGQNRVTNIQEGDEIWIVVIDNDENIDCDIRDKMWPDIKVMDFKTGAYILWDPGCPGCGTLADDYLEETGADTGIFVSKRPFQVGTRLSFAAGEAWKHTHAVDLPDPTTGRPDDFLWGHYMYADSADADDYGDNRGWFGSGGSGTNPDFQRGFFLDNGLASAELPSDSALTNDYLIGRFENMDTLIGMYQDPNDATDVAVGQMKIIDVEATISWDAEIYKDANAAATITVVDADENLNCNEVEAVPVFIIVNPGSWNPVDANPGIDEGGLSPTNFCMLKRTGGVAGDTGAVQTPVPIRWYNIYNAHKNALYDDGTTLGAGDGRYYIHYPVTGDDNVSFFDTVDPDGITPVLFHAWETGTNTGVFQLNLNSILDDLEFKALNVRDVLVAYYLDPNDFDDFKLAAAYIEEKQHSVTAFTDAARVGQSEYWLGRDAVYVQVIDANANVDPCCPEQVVVHICDPHGEDDAEWLILDEVSSNSPVFFTFAGTQLWPVWDALGVGLADSIGGFQLQLDNWKIETFNEDDIYVRYNDVYYGRPNVTPTQAWNHIRNGLADLGDADSHTSFPPWITRIRVANDVSFNLMSIGDTQVYDGQETKMHFLDRQGNRISGYVNSDCVFIEVIDPDQDEDPYRRERIDAFWDGGQNWPFGPMPLNEFICEFVPSKVHPVNPLLGDTNIFNDSPKPYSGDVPYTYDGAGKLYVLNPRNGHWAGVDLMETGVATGDFVSVICIDLVAVYSCVPSLYVVPGDTIVAFYQDPSNHSDNAMISIKVGIGGSGTPPSQASTTMFVDADGNEVANYTDADLIYVKVVDPSHTGVETLESAVEIDGQAFSVVRLEGAPNDTFITAGLDLGAAAGDTITATYQDPTDPTDTSSDTITIIASELAVDAFYAGPNPFESETTFGFSGSGIASVMSVAVYDLTGTVVWADEEANVTEIVWNGTDEAGAALANGAYIYTITATDGTNTFNGKGTVFVNR